MFKKDRYIWLAVSLAAFTILLAVAFVPTALAQPDVTATEEYLRVFEEVFHYIEENYVEEIDPEVLFEGAMKGMFDTLDDPYSYFLDETDMDSLGLTTNGSFGGVGLTISKQTRSDTGEENPEAPLYIQVVSPIEDTPGYRAGINAGDLILEINGESTADFTIDDAAELIRGMPGTLVTLTIKRGNAKPFKVDITRDIVEVPTVKFAMIDEIAYLKLTQFTPFTDDRVREAFEYFNKQGYKGLVVDVRNNGGGRLSTVIEVSDMFLSEGTIVSTRSRVPRENEVFTADRSILVGEDIPIVVTIDRGSASASEILAGALKDSGRAVVIGETSFGKGSVQQVRDFGDGGFRLTTSRYYTPSGKNIDKIGIAPDIEVTEPALTGEEEASLDRLTEEWTIPTFVRNNPRPTEAELDAFIRRLHEDGIMLEDRVLRRLISNEINRTNNNPPVYDLEFDLVLQEAVRQIESMIR
ncbi:MAG: S41 family peptidase [Spirochaetales bacterium]|nr:S41 family peptidase [Spirochaetales bacterium]